MNVCQAMTGQGGWPLSIFMTPQQKPFFAGTYFPKKSRYQMPGFLQLLSTIAGEWSRDKEQMMAFGDKVETTLRNAQNGLEQLEPTKEMVKAAYRQFVK